MIVNRILCYQGARDNRPPDVIFYSEKFFKPIKQIKKPAIIYTKAIDYSMFKLIQQVNFNGKKENLLIDFKIWNFHHFPIF